MATQQAPATGSQAPATDLTDPVFRRVLRGYDPKEVRAHLARVAGVVRDLESRLGQKAAGSQTAQPERDLPQGGAPADPYAAVSAHVADLLRGFDHDVERLRVKANTEAERVRTEARVQAQMELVNARLKADRLRSEVEALRSSKMDELRTMRDHLARSLKELEMAVEGERSEDHVVVLGEADHSVPVGAEPKRAGEPSATSPTSA